MPGAAALGECWRDVGLFSPAPSMIKQHLFCKTRFEWVGNVASMSMEALSVFHSSLISPIGRVPQASHCSSSSKAFAADDRLALRHAESRPIWERMREYLASEATMNVMPEELFRQALTYLRNYYPEHVGVDCFQMQNP